MSGLSARPLWCLCATAAFATSTPAQVFSTRPVPGNANIFVAGHGGPAAYGGGNFPASDMFPAGPNQTLQFSSVTGSVTLDTNLPYNGPDGGTQYTSTNIDSTGGIAGIVHTNLTMFLCGVFLDGTEPAGAAPARLTFTAPDDFTILTPQLRQVFFIGDGRTSTGSVQDFFVTPTATRIFLGFADGFNNNTISGPPRAYDDNGGSLTAVFRVQPVPEPSAILLCGMAAAFAAVRRRIIALTTGAVK